MADYRIVVTTSTGVELFSYVPHMGLTYTIAANSPGRFTVVLDGAIEYQAWSIVNVPDFTPTGAPQTPLATDMLVQIWRKATAGPEFSSIGSTYNLERVYFVREITRFTTEEGQRRITIAGPDVMEILARRIVAYSDGTVQADKTAAADNLIKAYVRQNLGPDATDGDRNLDSGYWSVDNDTAQGASVAVKGSTHNLLQVCQAAANASRTAGIPVYFDVVPFVAGGSSGSISLTFRTYVNQIGRDMSAFGIGQVLLSQESGSLRTPSRLEDWDDEANAIYTTGIGTLIDDVVERSVDTAREGRTIWARREWWENTRDQATTELVGPRGNAALTEHEPRLRFEADIVDSESAKYGRDYKFGDRVAASYLGQYYAAMIRAVSVRVDDKGGDKLTLHFDGADV